MKDAVLRVIDIHVVLDLIFVHPFDFYLHSLKSPAFLNQFDASMDYPLLSL